MADMDLDDLDGPSKVPSRTSRFAPKNSKLKPQPGVKLKSEPVSTEQQAQEFNSAPLKKEEPDSHRMAPDSVPAKSEYESKSSIAVNETEPMEVEGKPEGEDAEDDAETVVREIDVFFTPYIDSKTQLYVLQYPLRPRWRPYELDERCQEVRVKPRSAEVEIDLSLDVDSQNYDAGANTRARMTKQTLSSSMSASHSIGYAVGLLKGNKLHINPLKAVVQLRPSMEHFKAEELKDEKSAGPSRKLNKLPMNSNEQNSDLGENWVPLKYHSSISDYSALYLEKMAVDQSSSIQFSMSPYDYVSSLCPGASNDDNKPRGLARRHLISLPLEERYKALLREGPQANRFDTLKHYAENESTEDILVMLQKFAHLVQGLWVPKTSLVFGGHSGIEGLARDYMLLLFSKSPVISCELLNNLGPLGKAMKGMLSSLAVERPSLNDWKFKEPMDRSFMKLYPHVVKRQEQAWEDIEKRLTEHIGRSGRIPLVSKNFLRPDMAQMSGASINAGKVSARSSNGAVSKTPLSNETREVLQKGLQKLFQTNNVCSFQQICHRLRDMAVSVAGPAKGEHKKAVLVAAANGVDVPQEELHEIISQFATNIHGVYVSKSSSDHPQYDPLRKIVIDLLIAEGPNAKLKKAAIVEAAKIQLSRDITPIEYQKVLNELCISQGSAWVLKRGDGNLK
ncbi:hypothetical protein NMG60_11008005 [Bertholletia excelsa]